MTPAGWGQRYGKGKKEKIGERSSEAGLGQDPTLGHWKKKTLRNLFLCGYSTMISLLWVRIDSTRGSTSWRRPESTRTNEGREP